ncbi:MAG: biotin/lipoyl-binding protein [Bacteroidales bacterium]|nr:biotin/lipoyl-binding protein [Bacteroidales bacterium]
MKSFKFTINGQQYDTTVEDLGNQKANVTVNGMSFEVSLGGETTVAAPAPEVKAAPAPAPAAAPAPEVKAAPAPAPAAAPAATAAGAKVVSPLPGSIIKVLVSEGQAVKKGDTLLTLESMKMENPVAAEQDGTVKQICVTAGQSVMQDDVLIVLG